MTKENTEPQPEQSVPSVIVAPVSATPTPVVGTKIRDFNTIEEQLAFAEQIINSGLAYGLKTAQQVVGVINYAKALNVEPEVALTNIVTVNGRPTLSATLIAILLKRAGYAYEWVKDYEQVEGSDNKDNKETVVRLYWKCPIRGKVVSQDHRFTVGQAALAGYLTKDNWKRMPKEMMRARCLTSAVRAIAPEALMGHYETSEIADNSSTTINYEIDDSGNAIIIED